MIIWLIHVLQEYKHLDSKDMLVKRVIRKWTAYKSAIRNVSSLISRFNSVPPRTAFNLGFKQHQNKGVGSQPCPFYCVSKHYIVLLVLQSFKKILLMFYFMMCLHFIIYIFLPYYFCMGHYSIRTLLHASC